ncbi:MAG TPA: hypothetical protein VH741_06490 [Candidatus Limnocylindrales bacterium]
MRKLLVRGLLAAAATVVLLPIAALGHGGGLPWIYIEATQVWPGQPFHVLVIDMGPFTDVSLEAEAGGRRVVLGQVETGPQGHAEIDVTLPADFPIGYAQLYGNGDDGTAVNAVLAVGDVPGVTPLVPSGPGLPAVGSAPWWTDPSVLTLAAFVGGAALLLGWVVLRGRPSTTATTATSATPALPARPRRRKGRR